MMAAPKAGMRLTGAGKVIERLRGKSLKGKATAELDVGYRAPYAVFVHENLTANHPNGGQAKFLEAPSRTLRPQISAAIRESLLRGRSIADALNAGGQILFQASQDLVPVDTGYLKNSGYVRIV